MPIRPLKLPADLVPLAEMLPASFQYPENEAWSVQEDEKEQTVAMLKNLRRMWPLIRLMQLLSPSLQDIIRGYVWEEGGQVVGTTIIQRRGSTDVWVIGTVGVLPAYRRRGIARKLVGAALGMIRAHGGKRAFLNVIDGNLPARTLYEQLGFEHYSGTIEFNVTLEHAPPEPALPTGYTQSPLGRYDWRPRYELEKRISTKNLLKYEPVEENRFRDPAMMRLLLPLIMFAQGMRDEGVSIHSAEGELLARGFYSVPTRDKGLIRMGVRLDPAHPTLAPYLVGYLLHKAVASKPGYRAKFSVPTWMEAVVDAAEEAGFRRRLEYCRMGLML